jgi:hypothetical protein
MSRFSNDSTPTDRPGPAHRSFGIVSNLLPVRLILLWGEGRAGALFLRDAHAPTGEPESVGARLNDPDTRFLPLSVHGVIELVRLGALACVECMGEPPEVTRLVENGARREPVSVELMTGEVIRGDLLAYAPPTRARLSDLLNQAERFFLLAREGRAVYVNREAVATVRAGGGEPSLPGPHPSAVLESP